MLSRISRTLEKIGRFLKQNMTLILFLVLLHEVIFLLLYPKDIIKHVQPRIAIILAVSLIFIIYRWFYLTHIWTKFKTLFNSNRYDLILTSILYVYWLVKHYNTSVTEYWLPLIYYTLCYLAIRLIIYYLCEVIKCIFRKEPKGFLLSDTPIDNNISDKLWYFQLANQFADSLYNEWSTWNIIFSIESGWGKGKTSFLNLLNKNPIIKKECIVFQFNAWHFDNDSDLLKNFLWELSATLQSKYYLSKLDNQFEELLSVVSENASERLIGIKLNFSTPKSLKEIKWDINDSMKTIWKKLVIIIDDIDRLTSSKAKSLFRLIDLCRDFYNTSYVLCYDNDNFNAIDEILKVTKEDGKVKFEEEIDNTNIRNYLEKIVNIKYSLHPHIGEVKKYFFELFTTSWVDFSQSSEDGIKKWIDILFSSDNFAIYWTHIGNIRSLKRLFNFFLVKNYWNKNKIYNLFDESNWGLYFHDFIKLSILNLHYDRLYFDIVNENILESKTAELLYSSSLKSKYKAAFEYKGGRNEYSISPKLVTYIGPLKWVEKSIINNIFTVGLEKIPNQIDEKIIYAWNRLDQYISIIDTTDTIDFNKYISDSMDKFLKDTEELVTIFTNIEKIYGKRWIVQFLLTYETLAGDHTKAPLRKTTTLINYIVNNFHQYSINSLAYCYDNILKILDHSVGRENYFQNCLFIWDFIYGRNTYVNQWIINGLINQTWKVKGLYNVLHLRRYIESGYNWNFQRWVTGSEELNQPFLFYAQEISRHIYDIFKKEFIKKNINIFEQLFNLEVNWELTKDEWVSTWRFWDYSSQPQIIAFTIFQLTNWKDGVWYYDQSWTARDASKQGIKKQLNEYYFNKCFVWATWIKYFINYIFWFLANKDIFDNSSEINQWFFLRFGATTTAQEDWGVLDVFDAKKLKKFFIARKADIDEYIWEVSDQIYIWFNWIKSTYKYWLELLETEIDKL